MWRRRDPTEPEPVEEKQPAPAPPTPSPPPVTEAAVEEPPPAPEPPVTDDDPYAQLENFFNEPLVLEDIPAPPPTSPGAARAEPPPASGAAPPGMADTVQRLEQFGQRLAARFEALEKHVQEGSAQTLEALRRLGERMGSELAMLDKRAVNLELTMARLRATTEALETSLRKLPDMSTPEPSSVEPELPPPVPSFAAPSDDPRPDAPPPAPADALFTLEEEVPPSDWDDDPPLEDPPSPDPTWP